MKRCRVIISLFLIISLLTSCNNKKQDNIDTDISKVSYEFDILETKDIVLGNEVNSVDFTTVEGEKITFTNTADFYEIFDEVGFTYEDGKKYSCNAEMKLRDQSKSLINMNAYRFDGAELYEFRTKKEGADDFALVEEYAFSKQLENNQFERSMFSRYFYKDEKAFCGSEDGTSGNVIYKSDEYPLIPESGTELVEMQARSANLRNIIVATEFFKKYEPCEMDGNIFDYNQFVTREYKLYENYIVFKQTAPFLDIPGVTDPHMEIFYNLCINSDYSVTQEAYCNVKTGEIELIKVYGETILSDVYIGFNLEINMQMYIHDLVESESKGKIDALINYVKANAD